VLVAVVTTTVMRASLIGVRFDWQMSMVEELRAAAEALQQGEPEPFASLMAEDAEWRGISRGHLWWKDTQS
jgi:hypothetical protein